MFSASITWKSTLATPCPFANCFALSTCCADSVMPVTCHSGPNFWCTGSASESVQDPTATLGQLTLAKYRAVPPIPHPTSKTFIGPPEAPSMFANSSIRSMKSYFAWMKPFFL